MTEILFYLYVLPILVGLILGICLWKIRKTYILSAIMFFAGVIWWYILSQINTHGSEGPGMIALMYTVMTLSFVFVEFLKFIIKNKKIKITLNILLIFVFCGVLAVFSVNAYVKNVGGKTIITPEEAEKLQGVDCILVLGCQVKGDGNPSDMLADRLKRGIELYKMGAAPKIIMSGDHGRVTYDEVNTMKDVAIEAGISSSDVFMDHAGFSTYESMYRARDIFGADKIIIVSQDYHLYRAVYIAKKLGIEAYGVNSDYHVYLGQTNREVREILARCKDFVKTIYKPEPTFLGDVIPVSGDGNLTND